MPYDASYILTFISRGLCGGGADGGLGRVARLRNTAGLHTGIYGGGGGGGEEAVVSHVCNHISCLMQDTADTVASCMSGRR